MTDLPLFLSFTGAIPWRPPVPRQGKLRTGPLALFHPYGEVLRPRRKAVRARSSAG